MLQATKYYANILTLYSPLVQKLLAKVTEMGLEIDMIAPDHGILWRDNPGQILKAYDKWSSHEGNGKALVIYDTMWHSTEMMANAIADGIIDEGVSVQLLDLRQNHRSDVMTEVLSTSAIALGCPTLNNGLLPRMAGFLMYMRGLKPTNKIGAAFGSFGWSGEAVKLMNEAMEAMKFELIDPGVKIKYVPEHDNLKDCIELGRKIGRAVKEKTS
jgi:flavorubredoxin